MNKNFKLGLAALDIATTLTTNVLTGQPIGTRDLPDQLSNSVQGSIEQSISQVNRGVEIDSLARASKTTQNE